MKATAVEDLYYSEQTASIEYAYMPSRDENTKLEKFIQYLGCGITRVRYRYRNMNRYAADFETTTDPDDCRVWAWGLYNIETEKFQMEITVFLTFRKKVNYFELKFGEFILLAGLV